ncbi:Protein component of the small (40S) ribosomal subunit [Dimargaris verticillata]|uniref:Protein component of the small (40S) ribosomal subunit n=1 Tax=Dimargaris verticillata TaxID=2761393 RepID=A0A9W8EC23_9FUNG|nr:Protein component of the small (40S) ribosomal subunit [Dimargaris verticillata]
MPAFSVKDVPAHAFINAYAAHLKQVGKLAVPEWTDIVKTSSAKELPPFDPDWFYIRTAAIARHVYLRTKGTGVGHLRKKYGGNKRRGHRPNRFSVSSGSIARRSLQALEQLGVLQKAADGGRKITSQGQRDLDRISGQIAKVDEA